MRTEKEKFMKWLDTKGGQKYAEDFYHYIVLDTENRSKKFYPIPYWVDKYYNRLDSDKFFCRINWSMGNGSEEITYYGKKLKLIDTILLPVELDLSVPFTDNDSVIYYYGDGIHLEVYKIVDK